MPAGVLRTARHLSGVIDEPVNALFIAYAILTGAASRAIQHNAACILRAAHGPDWCVRSMVGPMSRGTPTTLAVNAPSGHRQGGHFWHKIGTLTNDQ